jgi:hypothetical protein
VLCADISGTFYVLQSHSVVVLTNTGLLTTCSVTAPSGGTLGNCVASGMASWSNCTLACNTPGYQVYYAATSNYVNTVSW